MKPTPRPFYRHFEAYYGTLREGDVEGWLDTLTDDCVFMAPGTPAVRGRDAIRQWAVETFFDPFHVELDYDFEDLHFAGDWAHCWGWFRQTLTPRAGGDVAHIVGKFLDVFRRMPDGEWLLARVAFSADTA